MLSDTLLKDLEHRIEGHIRQDDLNRIIYSTDASIYREKPLAVIIPKSKNDLVEIIKTANKNKLPIVPRGAGTSLAGQVVGNGIVIDITKHFNSILELNVEEHWVKVEPGVVLDELNQFLKPHGLFFGPETSTSNRCVLGGMVGNNSCGAHSILYGSTRDHVLEVETILSDGSLALFGPLTKEDFLKKTRGDSLENKIYHNIHEILSDKENQKRITEHYPDPNIKRRNHGYAIDLLLENEVFSDKSNQPFNFSKIIAGSEGTLAFATEIKLNLVPLPPKNKGLVCAHFNSLREAFNANLVALKYKPGAVEFMDSNVLECTKSNIEQQKNRFFLKNDPKAILIIEFERDRHEDIEKAYEKLVKDLKEKKLGYHYPLILNDDIDKVWNLRKAGLGLLSNVPGDKKSVTVIEDTAVNVEQLPDYMEDFQKLLDKYGLDCAYHAHIGSGELHLRPILNLKEEEDRKKFKGIAEDIARLVKSYKGSLSGEHGDGRLRGNFIPFMVGEENYNLLKQVKKTWDPNNIFNPGKIIDTPDMIDNLRIRKEKPNREIETIFDFSKNLGIIRAAEQCNGSGDCRKSEIFGGSMCPSFQATRDENHVTRARANTLREYLTYSDKKNPFDHKDIYEVMDLCLSCKACKSECPSNVDVAKLKAEFLQHYYDNHGVPFRTKLIANITQVNNIGSIFSGLTNFFLQSNRLAPVFMNLLGFSPKRKMPAINKTTLSGWVKKYKNGIEPKTIKKTVYLFNDEFTNFNDSHIGIKAIQLLNKLGYKVIIPKHIESGRSFLSKGLVRKAQKIAIKNVHFLKDMITEDSPLIGIEPSTILTFRDEYPDLTYGEDKQNAQNIARNAFMIDEFIAREIDHGNLDKAIFTNESLNIKLHGHCQQKAIASTSPTMKMLSFPQNYTVEEIPSGCCGMAGSFGYEKEHYDISMKVGELVLFPEIRKTSSDTVIVAPGTSCRHQIKDGTGKDAKHPVEVLYEALKPE